MKTEGLIQTYLIGELSSPNEKPVEKRARQVSGSFVSKCFAAVAKGMAIIDRGNDECNTLKVK